MSVRTRELEAAKLAAGEAVATDEAVKAAEAALKLATDALAAAEKAETAAKDSVRSLVKPLLADAFAQRQKAIEEYEKALSFIGEAINRDTKPLDGAP
ncbi:MAG: hypothetical protein IPK97_01440 [Ahniella sp.]|nr:hypothetical protein [Ahniella sp.]